MKRSHRLLATACALLLLTGFAGTKRLTERQRAIHALNRLAFGARPGDVERVLSRGLDVWIDEQLHPERIADRAVESKIAQYPTLQMSSREIGDRFYKPLLELRKEAKQQAAAGGKDGQETTVADLRKEMRDKIPPENRPGRVIEELVAQRIVRASDSERQLNEVMVDFWMNHFNVFAGKGVDRFLLTSYERDTIRPHIWGRFEDLLMATAKSPAMLFYLDNARSVADPEHRPLPPMRMRRRFEGPFAEAAMRRQQAGIGRRQGGLNENYAREIMELHTLGVDGGYTQKDVTELARVFTGWTIGRPEDGGGFIFRPMLHDAGAKSVLGVYFRPGGGIEEGERMIRFLAHQPATAQRIAYKLCQRLVADEPPKPLVDRVARKFLDSDGDLRQTVRAVIASPEFWDAATYRGKVKSPFEYVISAVRAVDAHVDNATPIARALQQIGEPLYGAQPPTGYSDKADAWVNTGALMNRLNFALALAANRMPGVHGDVTSLISQDAAAEPERSVDALAFALTGGELTAETRSTIKQRLVSGTSQAEDPRETNQLPLVAGLILGSPEFQRQ